jgi:tetratricopeptide (TPR) repeat protein
MAEVVAIGEQLAASMTDASTLRISAAARTASVLALAGKRAEAAALLEAALRAAASVTDPATIARLEQARANRALFEGRAGEYIERSTAAADAFATAGDRRLACVARLNVGHGLLELGMASEATSTLRAVVDEAERLGLRNIASAATQNLGWALFRSGQVKEGLHVLRASIDQFAEQGNRRLEGFSHVYIARILLEGGDVARAERSVQQGLALAESALPLRVAALAVLAAIHTRASRASEAVTAAREALDGLEAHGVEDGEGFVRLACVEALRAAGGQDAARALDRARERLRTRAGAIHRDDWRDSFLNVPEHARTLALAGSPRA